MDDKQTTEPDTAPPSNDASSSENGEPVRTVKRQTVVSDSLMARMKRVDPNLIRRYHQKSGQ
jgi:hypothetical protein